jgi:hypothetical protein
MRHSPGSSPRRSTKPCIPSGVSRSKARPLGHARSYVKLRIDGRGWRRHPLGRDSAPASVPRQCSGRKSLSCSCGGGPGRRPPRDHDQRPEY